MTQTQAKQLAAVAALAHVRDDMIVGVGTGSTVDLFIDALASANVRIRGAISSSEASTARLRKHGIEVVDLNSADAPEVYIKGGGGALTREKIVAAASTRFICIVDESKVVDVLGTFPLPVEVIPMARSYIAREMIRLGGKPVWREGFNTDNGNHILDVHNLRILDPVGLETEINQIAGIVTVGLFARRPADLLIVGGKDGVKTLR